MKKRLIVARCRMIGIWCFFASFSGYSQDLYTQKDSVVNSITDSSKNLGFFTDSSSLKPLAFYPVPFEWQTPKQYPYNKKRVKLVATGNIIGYSVAMIGLYAAWYSKYEQTSFHTFNDNREWLQIDKVGHAYSAYAESFGSMEMWRWTGINRKHRILLGGLSGAAYQTVIEILDGFSKGWGWSWGDFGANVLGSGLLAGQELAWDEQRVRFKLSFYKKKYDTPELTARANELFGESRAERFIKDYNAQTYWLSANVKSFMPKSTVPAWLNVAVGYGAEGMFGGEENIGKNENGDTTFYRPDIKRYRQWYLAPDIDLSRIKTNNKVLRFTLGLLNIIKVPTPALEFSNKKIRLNWGYF